MKSRIFVINLQNKKLTDMTQILVTLENSKEWIRKMMELSNSIDTSVVDMDDERTRYLMSK